MKASDIITLARFLTNTNDVTAPDSNLLTLLDERNRQLVVHLSKLKEDFNVERSTYDLVASQEEYPLPSDIIRLKRMEIQWESGGKWYPITFYDINETDLANDATTIANNFSVTQPFAEVYDDSVFLRPIPSVANSAGLKLWYVQEPAALSTTADTPESPDYLHRTLADLLAIDIRQLKGELTGMSALQEEAVIWEFVKNQVSPRVTDHNLVAKPHRENYE